MISVDAHYGKVHREKLVLLRKKNVSQDTQQQTTQEYSNSANDSNSNSTYRVVDLATPKVFRLVAKNFNCNSVWAKTVLSKNLNRLDECTSRRFILVKQVTGQKNEIATKISCKKQNFLKSSKRIIAANRVVFHETHVVVGGQHDAKSVHVCIVNQTAGDTITVVIPVFRGGSSTRTTFVVR